MYNYKAPLRDIQFVTDELLNAQSHYENLPNAEDVTPDLLEAILSEAAKFSEQSIAPLNRSGDEEGCLWNSDGVKTPKGFKESYQLYIDNGWTGLAMPEEFGGQGLPESVAMMVMEIIAQANQSWSMYSLLSAGCRATLIAHGEERLKKTYLPKLVAGTWTGTMCLTESNAGSDLNLLTTKAQKNEDGSYTVTGTKIFISSGEHDMAENIIHIVLARLPNAPKGTRGISLFIVPKFLPDQQGECGQRNAVNCGSIEHKMGIHGNATCVMNFDGATGFLIGEENKGLACMFTFMNAARVGTGMQGLTHAEIALQGGLSYAIEREAGRSLTGVKSPERPADLLIVHADIRRMLLTIKSFSEGCRAFSHYLGQIIDKELLLTGNEQKEANNILSLLTPIAKGFMTEVGLEAASLGVQIYGGHGYIREWGMEQNLRDSRISTLYEGTTGIQALDLLSRKILADNSENFTAFVEIITKDLNGVDQEFSAPLLEALEQWQALTRFISTESKTSRDELGAASVDYLMYSGYVVLAWFWAKMGHISKNKLADQSDIFYRMKLETARFYFKKILPRTQSIKTIIESGSEVVMAISDEDFIQASTS